MRGVQAPFSQPDLNAGPREGAGILFCSAFAGNPELH
jgi:hypothetical protein